MKNFKWIVSDIDGTLLKFDFEKRINILDMQTQLLINEIIKNNNLKFTLATGRHPLDAYFLLNNKINFPINSYIIGLNGASVYDIDNQCFVYENFYNQEEIEDIEKIVQYCLTKKKYKAIIFAYVKDFKILFIKHHNNIDLDLVNLVKSYESQNEIFTYQIVDQLDITNQVYKMCIFFADEVSSDQSFFENLQQLSKNIDILFSNERCIELVKKDINKANAVAFLQAKYNFDSQEILIFGDSGNDICMFKNYQYTITRKCANEKIKSLAWKIYDGGPSTFISNALVDIFKS